MGVGTAPLQQQEWGDLKTPMRSKITVLGGGETAEKYLFLGLAHIGHLKGGQTLPQF